MAAAVWQWGVWVQEPDGLRLHPSSVLRPCDLSPDLLIGSNKSSTCFPCFLEMINDMIHVNHL